MASGKWIRAGVVGIDSGTCWIGDPCYILHCDHEKNRPELGEDWSDFCDKLNPLVTQFDHALGYPGLGVVVSTGYGDGVYPIYVKYDEDGTVTEARIVFIPSKGL